MLREAQRDARPDRLRRLREEASPPAPAALSCRPPVRKLLGCGLPAAALDHAPLFRTRRRIVLEMRKAAFHGVPGELRAAGLLAAGQSRWLAASLTAAKALGDAGRLSCRLRFRMRCRLIPLALLLTAATGLAAARQDSRAEKLNCSAKHFGPYLDFEFRFLAGSWFYLPTKQFWGKRFALDFEALIQPVDGTPGRPVRLSEHFESPQAVQQGTKGQLYFPGAYSLGTGRYRADWQIRDDQGRSCQGSRTFRVTLARRERAVKVTLAPGVVEDPAIHLFRVEDRIERPHLETPRRLKVFVSLDVLGRRRRIRPRPVHVLPHFSALRQLGRILHFNEFSVVCFSFEDQAVVLRQDYRKVINFRPLADVTQKLDPETVDVGHLMRGSELEFFEQMLSDELFGSAAPDAVVFVGHDMMFGKKLPRDAVRRLQALGAEFAFLDASRLAWVGVMGGLVRALEGKEYMLRRPADLAKALQGLEHQVGLGRPQ